MIDINLETELLSYCKTQFEQGSWANLVSFEVNDINESLDKASIALYIAAAHFQLGNIALGRKFFVFAKEWKCDVKLLSKVLYAGIYNNIGIQKLLLKDMENIEQYFSKGAMVSKYEVNPELSHVRLIREAGRFDILERVVETTKQRVSKLESNSEEAKSSEVSILKTEIELINHELTIMQKRRLAGMDEENLDDNKKKIEKFATSQLGQDLWVLEKTGYKKNGFFVEFGATNGILLSNTYLLEKKFDWSGICAEPNPEFFEKLKQNRNCIVSNECIGTKTGEMVKFVFAQEYGGMQTHMADDMHGEKRRAYQEQGHEMELETISLHDFLVKHNAPKQIDYLSIDTEGSEYEILQSFPFEQWDIRFFTVEHNFTERRKDIRSLLEGYGYKCQETKFDDWYERIESRFDDWYWKG